MGSIISVKKKMSIEDLSKKVLENAASSSSASTSSSSRMLSAEPPSITTPKRMKITDHFPIQNNENSMEERVARMAAKDGLPLSVFVTSSDLRDLFKAKGHSLPRSSTSIRMIVMNYGMTLRMKVLHELSELKDTDHRFSRRMDVFKTNSYFWKYASNRLRRNFKKKLKESDLDLDIDIVAITTDTASVMVKTGTLILAFQQLCYAYGLQLGILDVIYKKNEHESIQQGQIDVPLENPEAETNNDGDRSNITDDDRFIVEVSSSSEKSGKYPEAGETCCGSSLSSRCQSLSLRRRISQRRTNLTALLIYLQNPCSYHASFDDETFHLPAKNLLLKEIKDFVIRMQFSLSNSYDNNDYEEVVQAVQITNNNEEVSPSDLTLQQELELTNSMTLYESGGSMRKYLTFTCKTLKGIPPTSVEAERAFSAAGYIASKIRSSLADDTLDMLCFLRKHFKLNADETN
ncbi:hypothetical protein ILUMI_00867 [Ignelater luminosus]|uniref:HAT C-terminal dimerisation domain-containing protein n=1 Tax=Ignelater luminosus TaxID=2038154 RepID=A0A8K0DLF6_IGNLU|nr:hypothetical protein ILUMI_00867 [Ignelater luminosus]